MNDFHWNILSLQVATNGIISPHDLPMEKQYVDDGFPTEFPVIAPFLADIDTSNGKGAIYYRQTESPGVLNRIAAEVRKGFPDTQFTPTHAIIATWENVAAYTAVTRTSESSREVRKDLKYLLHVNFFFKKEKKKLSERSNQCLLVKRVARLGVAGLFE